MPDALRSPRRSTSQQLSLPGAEPAQRELDLYGARAGHPPGYVVEGSSPHLARTLMVQELERLLTHVPSATASLEDYREAVLTENCLHKGSASNRKTTLRYLIQLYTLDHRNPSFVAMRFYWQAEPEGRPLVALLMAYLRDPALRVTAPYIQSLQQFESAHYQDMRSELEEAYGERFSTSSYKALAQHIASSWAQTGHLEGKLHKQRARALATPVSLAYAVELAALAGTPPEERLVTPYIKLLDVTSDRALSLAEDAGHRGWLRVNRLGRVAAVYPVART